MSQENVPSIERAYEAVSRLDAEALVALCEPDIEFRSLDHFFQAMRLRNGKALWCDFYPFKTEALEAVGLRE